MRIHEWGADDAIVPIQVDEVEVDLLLDSAYVYWNSRSIAYLRSAPHTAELEDYLILQRDLLRFGGKSEFGGYGIRRAARVKQGEGFHPVNFDLSGEDCLKLG